MKLYTEEQVKNALYEGFYLAMVTDGGLKEFEEPFINSLTPIELPTDEEIEYAGINKWDGYKPSNYLSAFIDGADWLYNKITSQINKQP